LIGTLELTKSQCDVLVASFDSHTLRTTGIEILSALWHYDVSAELARDARSPEELIARNREESYSWIIMIKQDSVLKIRTMDRKDVADVEIPTTQLITWLRQALRERGTRQHASSKHIEAPATIAATGHAGNPNQEVRVLVAGTKSKKFNRRIVIEQAQANAAGLMQQFLEGPIAAVEASDSVLELIQETTLSDAETWRKAEQSVDKNEKRYMRDIHDMLETWRSNWKDKSSSRHAFVYNFRTTKCIYYDLGA
jgi:eukaryotic translation initiation factor 2-alpha kinase 4